MSPEKLKKVEEFTDSKTSPNRQEEIKIPDPTDKNVYEEQEWKLPRTLQIGMGKAQNY